MSQVIEEMNEDSEKFHVTIIKGTEANEDLRGKPSYEFALHHVKCLARKWGIKNGQVVVLESDLNIFTNLLADLFKQYECIYRLSLDLLPAIQNTSDQAAPEDGDIQGLTN